MLHLNPQLKSLDLSSSYDLAFNQYINEYLPNLEHLSLSTSSDDDCGNGHQIIHFDNITSFEVDVDVFSCRSLSFPFSFGKLTRLHVHCLSLDQSSLNSLAKIRDLKIMELSDLEDYEDCAEELLQLDNVLKNVQHMKINLENVSAECVVRFLEQAESIENLSFHFMMKVIRPRLADKWKIEKRYGMVIIRK